MNEMCGRSVCGVDPLTALLMLSALGACLSAIWDKLTGKKPEPKVSIPPRQDTAEELAAKDLGRRVYAATKLIYGEPGYARIFDSYSDELRRKHLEEVAGYVDELAEIGGFIARCKGMPVAEREPYADEAETKVRRQIELLKRTYRTLV